MKKYSKFYFKILFLFLTILIFSCSENSVTKNNTNLSGKDSIFHDIKWSPETVLFDFNELQDLLEYNPQENYIYLKSTNQKARNLKKGDIIVVAGKCLKKVASVTITGNQIEVETEDALIVEAINDGRLYWDLLVDFKKLKPSSVYLEGKEDKIHLIQNDEIEFTDQWKNYEYTFKMSFKESYANVSLTIKKKIGQNISASFTCEGTIEKFRMTNDLVINNSEIRKMNYQNYGLKGDLTLKLVCAASGNDNENGVELLIPIISFLLPGLYLPVMLKMKLILVINAVVPLEGFSQVSAKFSYNSTTGFNFDGVDASLNASMGTINIEKNIAQTGAPGQIGANFGIGFPRLELSIANEILVPYIQTAFLIGGFYRTGTKPCQEAKAAFLGHVGMNLNITKDIKFKWNKELWNFEKILLQSGVCD